MSDLHEIGHTLPSAFPEDIDAIFAQLNPQDVEQFYKSYQLWSLQRQIELQQLKITMHQQRIHDNAVQMRQVEPSPIALSILAQLQAMGVEDIDLLDRMLERGDDWLDHTMQLLEKCEQLDVIQGDYTQWCENALEGAYDWIDSMSEAAPSPPAETVPRTTDWLDEVTEEILLQKLMSEDGDTEKIPVLRSTERITQPLEPLESETVEPATSGEALFDVPATEFPTALQDEATPFIEESGTIDVVEFTPSEPQEETVAEQVAEDVSAEDAVPLHLEREPMPSPDDKIDEVAAPRSSDSLTIEAGEPSSVQEDEQSDQIATETPIYNTPVPEMEMATTEEDILPQPVAASEVTAQEETPVPSSSTVPSEEDTPPPIAIPARLSYASFASPAPSGEVATSTEERSEPASLATENTMSAAISGSETSHRKKKDPSSQKKDEEGESASEPLREDVTAPLLTEEMPEDEALASENSEITLRRRRPDTSPIPVRQKEAETSLTKSTLPSMDDDQSLPPVMNTDHIVTQPRIPAISYNQIVREQTEQKKYHPVEHTQPAVEQNSGLLRRLWRFLWALLPFRR